MLAPTAEQYNELKARYEALRSIRETEPEAHATQMATTLEDTQRNSQVLLEVKAKLRQQSIELAQLESGLDMLVEVLEGLKVFILLLLLGVIAVGIPGCSVGRCALAKASELRAKSKAASRLPSFYFSLHCKAWLWRKLLHCSTGRVTCRSALIEQRPDSLVLRLSASPGSAAGRPTVGGGSSASTAWFG